GLAGEEYEKGVVARVRARKVGPDERVVKANLEMAQKKQAASSRMKAASTCGPRITRQPSRFWSRRANWLRTMARWRGTSRKPKAFWPAARLAKPPRATWKRAAPLSRPS